MSQFYASIQGNRGQATRQGTKKSGLEGHIRGWNLGARVWMFVDGDGQDRCQIVLTGGSNGRYSDKVIGQFTKEDLVKEEK